MKNLKNYGVKELNINEIEELNGGFLLTAGAIFLSALVIGGPILAWQSGHTVNGQPVKQ